jgi:hypothetical protein
MCRRHVEQAEERRFNRIALLTEQEAKEKDSVRFVVDVLCTNPVCYFRDETSWEERALRRRHDGRFQSCGSSACLTVNRCCLVELPSRPQTDSHKRRRYVLDQHSVDPKPKPRQGHGSVNASAA